MEFIYPKSYVMVNHQVATKITLSLLESYSVQPEVHCQAGDLVKQADLPFHNAVCSWYGVWYTLKDVSGELQTHRTENTDSPQIFLLPVFLVSREQSV
jgi:hypothetical protein